MTNEADRTRIAKQTRTYDRISQIIGFVAQVVFYLLLALVLLGVWVITPNSIRYPLLYSLTTTVEFSNVHVDPEPHDCDWSHAPIGNKRCHYEVSVKCEKDGETGRIGLTEKKCAKEGDYVYVSWIKRKD